MQVPSHLATLRSNIDAYNQQIRFEMLPYYKRHIEKTIKVIDKSNEKYEYGVVKDILQNLSDIDYRLCRKFKKNVVHVEENGGHPLIYYPSGPFKVAHCDIRSQKNPDSPLSETPSTLENLNWKSLITNAIEQSLREHQIILNNFFNEKFLAPYRMKVSKKMAQNFAADYRWLVRNLQIYDGHIVSKTTLLHEEIRLIREMLKPITDFIRTIPDLDIQFDIIIQLMDSPLCLYEYVLYDELLEILKANEAIDEFYTDNYLNRLKRFIHLCGAFKDSNLKATLLMNLFQCLRWGHKEFSQVAKLIHKELETCLNPIELKGIAYRIYLRHVLGKCLKILSILNKPLAEEKKIFQNNETKSNVYLLIDLLEILFPSLDQGSIKNLVKNLAGLKKIEPKLYQLESQINKAQRGKNF